MAKFGSSLRDWDFMGYYADQIFKLKDWSDKTLDISMIHMCLLKDICVAAGQCSELTHWPPRDLHEILDK